MTRKGSPRAAQEASPEAVAMPPGREPEWASGASAARVSGLFFFARAARLEPPQLANQVVNRPDL